MSTIHPTRKLSLALRESHELFVMLSHCMHRQSALDYCYVWPQTCGHSVDENVQDEQMKFVLLILSRTIVWLHTARSVPCPHYTSIHCSDRVCFCTARMRYPVPTCNELRKEGDICRPGQKPFSTTGTKPDGSFWYNVTNAYDTVCPCAPGLLCLEGFCKKRN